MKRETVFVEGLFVWVAQLQFVGHSDACSLVFPGVGLKPEQTIMTRDSTNLGNLK